MPSRSEIAEPAAAPLVVVTKSTVPVGTGDEVERILRETRPDGGLSPWSPTRNSCAKARLSPTSSARTASSSAPTDDARREVMTEIYRPLFLNQPPILFTDRRTSELIKYAANAFLALKITFINEIADLCEAVGANVQEVARGIGAGQPHRRQVPACGAGLWRLLLPQGHAGAGQDRAGRRHAPAHHRDGGGRQRHSASAPWRAR